MSRNDVGNYRPRFIDAACMVQLHNALPQDGYKYAPAASMIGINDPTSDTFPLTLWSASMAASGGSTLLPYQQPNTPMYLSQQFRPSPNASVPHKMDAVVYYHGRRGTALRYHSKDIPGHHHHNVTMGGSAGLVADYRLTGASSGRVNDLILNGASITFAIYRKPEGWWR